MYEGSRHLISVFPYEHFPIPTSSINALLATFLVLHVKHVTDLPGFLVVCISAQKTPIVEVPDLDKSVVGR
jgi:hypothetical protein